MSHADIIRALGGPTELARLLGIAPKTPLHWPRRGIPAHHWHQVERLPKAIELGITAEILAASRPNAPVTSRMAPVLQLPRATPPVAPQPEPTEATLPPPKSEECPGDPASVEVEHIGDFYRGALIALPACLGFWFVVGSAVYWAVT